MDVEHGRLRTLFASRPPPRWTPLSLVLTVALLVAATLVPVHRQPGASALHTIWAEDGTQFLQGALNDSPLHALTATYAGYLHVVPRIVAAVVVLFPVSLASALLTLFANLIAAVCAATIFVTSASHLRSVWIRGALAASIVLVPTGGVEAINNVSNVQWYLLFASFWILLDRPATRPGIVASGLFLAATALSSPLAVLLAPLAIARTLALPRGRDWVPSVALAAGLCIQIAAWRLSHFRSRASVGNPLDIAAAFAQRVAGVAVVGQRLGGALWVRWGWIWPVAATILFLGVLLFGVTVCGRRTRWLALLVTGHALAFYAVSVVLRHNIEASLWPPGTFHALAGRYTVVPILLLYTLVAVVLDRRPRRVPPSVWRVARLVCLALFLLAAAADFRSSGPRSRGPEWGDALAVARQDCAHHNLGVAQVQITPSHWKVEVPCAALESG